METNTHRKPNLLKWAIAVALVIVINLFFHYAISLVYVEPKHEKFCPMETYNRVFSDAMTCVDAGGQWTNTQLSPQEVTKAVKSGEALGWCNATFTCQQNYDDAHGIYNRNVFIVLIVLSLVVLALGVFLPIEILSLGFSWAGVVSLIIASARYWSDADNWMRVLILFVALVLLIWLAVKKFKQE